MLLLQKIDLCFLESRLRVFSSSFKIPSNVPPSGISDLSENIVAVYPDDFILRAASGFVVVSRGISNSSG